MKRPQDSMSLPPSGSRAALPGADSPAQSALRMTREAISRWRGAPLPPGSLPRDSARVSPQARWLAEAHAGLSHWIERGGFAQGEPAPDAGTLSPLPGPVMYRLPATAPADTRTASERTCRLN